MGIRAREILEAGVFYGGVLHLPVAPVWEGVRRDDLIAMPRADRVVMIECRPTAISSTPPPFPLSAGSARP